MIADIELLKSIRKRGKEANPKKEASLSSEFERRAYCCTPTAGFSAGVPLAVVARAAKKL
jgi:hypothetical protein